MPVHQIPQQAVCPLVRHHAQGNRIAAGDLLIASAGNMGGGV